MDESLIDEWDPVRRGSLVDAAVAVIKVQASAVRSSAHFAAELFVSHFVECDTTGTQDVDPRSLWEHRRVRGAKRSRAWEEAWLAASSELLPALGMSWFRVDELIDLGLGLKAYPVLDRALLAGRCHHLQAAAILKGVRKLQDPGHVRAVLASVLTDPGEPGALEVLVPELRTGHRTLWQIPAHKLTKIIAREAASLDPTTVLVRQREARDQRRVDYVSGEGFGPASLVLTGPEPELVAAYDHLDQQARLVQKTGECLDNLRFDLAVSHLTGGLFGSRPQDGIGEPGVGVGPSKRRATGATLIQIITPRRPADQPGDAPALLVTPKGLVPISGDEVARHATTEAARWQDLHVDPATGTATGLSRTYRPSRRMREFVKVRDGFVSRYPSGNATAELDHVTPFDHHNPSRGGPTTPSNLASQARRDHQAKTRRHYTVTGNANGDLTLTDRTGHSYISSPYHWLDPDPPPT